MHTYLVTVKPKHVLCCSVYCRTKNRKLNEPDQFKKNNRKLPERKGSSAPLPPVLHNYPPLIELPFSIDFIVFEKFQQVTHGLLRPCIPGI